MSLTIQLCFSISDNGKKYLDLKEVNTKTNYISSNKDTKSQANHAHLKAGSNGRKFRGFR